MLNERKRQMEDTECAAEMCPIDFDLFAEEADAVHNEQAFENDDATNDVSSVLWCNPPFTCMKSELCLVNQLREVHGFDPGTKQKMCKQTYQMHKKLDRTSAVCSLTTREERIDAVVCGWGARFATGRKFGV